MDDVKIENSKTLTLTLPSDPTSNAVSVSLYHEFGDLVSGPTSATRSSLGIYTITYGQAASGIYVLNAGGKYRADFTYTVSTVSYTQSQYINVYTPYITSVDFFNDHPELEDDWSDKFDKVEKKIRNIINTFCGQSFDYYPNKSIELSGTGRKILHLPHPIVKLTTVVLDSGKDSEETIHDSTDTTLDDNIEKSKEVHNFNSSYYIKYTGRFNTVSSYKISGDFGWQYVPNNIEQAADLLIEDLMNDDSEFRRHGIKQVEMDTTKYYTKDSFYESTGNIDADVLLMDYTLFVMDYVV